jgi:hypothetical protein
MRFDFALLVKLICPEWSDEAVDTYTCTQVHVMIAPLSAEN